MSKPSPHLEAGEKAMRLFMSRAKTDEAKRMIPAMRQRVMDWRNELKCCPFCSNPIADATVNYTVQAAVQALYKLYRWCGEKRRHEFKISEVKHLLDHTQYANLNHMARFGGIVYRPQLYGKTRAGWYGIHMERAAEFFACRRKAPVQITHNRFTGERTATIS